MRALLRQEGCAPEKVIGCRSVKRNSPMHCAALRPAQCGSYGSSPTAIKPKPLELHNTNTMKTPIKLLAVAILSLSFVSTGFPADDAMMKDHIMMKAGKVMMIKEGKSMPLDKELTLGNGAKVTPDGAVTMKDGTKMMMKEGDMMSMDGEMVKHDAKQPGH
jgi:hypothetical protein